MLRKGSFFLTCLYLAIRALDPTGKGRKRWSNRWKGALNAFDITFNGRARFVADDADYELTVLEPRAM